MAKIANFHSPKAFWQNKDWPEDFGNKLFLGRAINQLGSEIYGSDWNSDEPNPPPTLLTGDEETLRNHIRWLLVKDEPTIWKVDQSALLSGGEESHRQFDTPAQKILQPDDDIPKADSEVSPPFSKTEWQRGLQMARDLEEQRAKQRPLFNDVISRLIDRLRDGSLEAYLRDKTGGGFVKLTAEAWNGEDLDARFDQCQLDPAQPFSRRSIGLNHRYIFVDAGGLSSLIENDCCKESNTDMKNNEPKNEYFPPHVILAMEAVRHFQISEDNCPAVNVVERWLLGEGKAQGKAAQMGIELSPARAEMIAKIVRPLRFQTPTKK
ncbi:MAG: hypothetical protein AAF724_07075 [Pseudomonadota bacterium]